MERRKPQGIRAVCHATLVRASPAFLRRKGRGSTIVQILAPVEATPDVTLDEFVDHLFNTHGESRAQASRE